MSIDAFLLIQYEESKFNWHINVQSQLYLSILSFHNGQIPLQCTTHSNSIKQRIVGHTKAELTYCTAIVVIFCHCSIGSIVSECAHTRQQRFKNDKTSSMDSNSHWIGMPHVYCTLLIPQVGLNISTCSTYFINVELIQCSGEAISDGIQANIQTFVNSYILK